jgi:hypothetical protein
MAKKLDHVESVFSLVGMPPLQPVDLSGRWPALGNIVQADGAIIPISAHISVVTTHSRQAYERRFQNPGAAPPVMDVNGLPVLIGIDYEPTPVLVVADGRSRVGRQKRFSILFNVSLLQEARAKGVATYVSSTGEVIYACLPELMPTIVDLFVLDADEDTSIADLQVAVDASGMLEDDDEEEGAAERARRTTSSLVRKGAFGREVKQAYSGKCAMCGIDLMVVSGAHIYPASAPGSPDKVWNGISLCGNHHAAFDNFDIHVHPTSLKLSYSPRALEAAKSNPATDRFVKETFTHLVIPADKKMHPRKEMIEKRYDHYSNQYDWAKKL